MISIQEALQILQANLPDAKIDTVDLQEAHGRYLAESIAAPEPSPRYTIRPWTGMPCAGLMLWAQAWKAP